MAEGYRPIPRIVPGDVSLVSASKANELIDAINALMGARISPIANVGKMMAAGGQVIYDYTVLDGRLKKIEQAASTGALGGSGSANVNSLPFGVSNTSPNLNVAFVNVRYGTVGGIVPNGIATDINLTTPNSNTEIYLNITIDNNAAVTAASINTGTTPTPNTSTKAYARIANVQVLNGNVAVINQDLLYSQSFVACNRNTADPSTTPGTYYLQVS